MQKNPAVIVERAQCRAVLLAEAVRFELTEPFDPAVFKTAVIDLSTTLPRFLERAAGIEPATCPWQGYVLPLAPCPLVLAESVGVEPTRPFRSVGLAIRCLTIQPTLLVVIVII